MDSQRPIWTDQSLDNPHDAPDKAARVRAMFSAIASSYDLNNRIHSLGTDRAWRRAAVTLAGMKAGERVLDVACGTGDLALEFVRRGAGQVWGVDFTPAMLEIACRKNSTTMPLYLAGDAMRLPMPDQCVDIVSIAFGIRNVADSAIALREFARVLVPGGRLVILEFSHPKSRWFGPLYRFYCRHIMPRTATLIAGDRTGAYRYLPSSVDTFLDRTQMMQSIEHAGFTQISVQSLTLGIALLYRAVKSE